MFNINSINTLKEIHRLCVKNSCGYEILYCEAEDNFSFELVSSAKEEQFYIKRCYDYIDIFNALLKIFKES